MRSWEFEDFWMNYSCVSLKPIKNKLHFMLDGVRNKPGSILWELKIDGDPEAMCNLVVEYLILIQCLMNISGRRKKCKSC